MEPSGLEFGSQICQLCSLRQITQLLWASVFTLTKWAGYANSKMHNNVHEMQLRDVPPLILVGPRCVCEAQDLPIGPPLRAWETCCREEGTKVLWLLLRGTGGLSPGLGLKRSREAGERGLRGGGQGRGWAGRAWEEAPEDQQSLVLFWFPALPATCIAFVRLSLIRKGCLFS